MGDVLSLIEQAERTMDKEVATKGAAAMIEGRFTLEDFLEQLQQVKKMGSVSGMLSLLPGVPKDLKQASSAVDDRQIGQIEAIIRSMTPTERTDPAIIDGARRVRIANGSGTATADVNALLKQFREMQKMMKGIRQGRHVRGHGRLGGLFGRGPKLSPRPWRRWPGWAAVTSSPPWPGPRRAGLGGRRALGGAPRWSGPAAVPVRRLVEVQGQGREEGQGWRAGDPEGPLSRVRLPGHRRRPGAPRSLDPCPPARP